MLQLALVTPEKLLGGRQNVNEEDIVLMSKTLNIPALIWPVSGRFSVRLAVLIVIAAMMLEMPGKALAQGPKSVADLADQLSDAVVNISTAQTVKGRKGVPLPSLPPGTPFKDLFDDFLKRQQRNGSKPRKVSSLGSGFVIDPSGIIITNNHVIKDADEIIVTFPNGDKLDAKVVGRDPEIDVAVLKVKPKKPLKSVELGNSDKLRVGDWVMAIGNPFGLGGTVTLGIVSARNRRINSGPYDDFIQTDAAINRGNSGGPLFDMDGKVVGINTAIISPTGGSIGIGFAVPTSMASGVIAQLRKFGTTRRGWIGVRIQNVSKEIAESRGLEKPRGALVAGVTEKGPAEAAGLEPADIIIEFNGKPVADVRELQRVVAQTPIEDEVGIVVWRNGTKKKLRLKVGRREEGLKLMNRNSGKKQKTSEKKRTVLGLTLSVITPVLRKRYKISSKTEGVVITGIDPTSSAAAKRIRPGTVITEVDQVPVRTPKDVSEQVNSFAKKGRKSVLLTLAEPSGDVRFAAVRLKETKKSKKKK